jgi:hypothetical protein
VVKRQQLLDSWQGDLQAEGFEVMLAQRLGLYPITEPKLKPIEVRQASRNPNSVSTILVQSIAKSADHRNSVFERIAYVVVTLLSYKACSV